MVKKVIRKVAAKLRGYPPVKHTVEVEALDLHQAAAIAKKHIIENVKSFGDITMLVDETLIVKEGIEDSVKVHKRSSRKPMYVNNRDEFHTLAEAIVDAKEFALECRGSTSVHQMVDGAVAEIEFIPGRLPKWKVTFVEEKIKTQDR